MPEKELKGFKRVDIYSGETVSGKIRIPVDDLKKWDVNKNEWKFYKGNFTINVSRNASEPVLKHFFRVK